MTTKAFPLTFGEIMAHYEAIKDYLCRVCGDPFERYEGDDKMCEECDWQRKN